MVKVILVQVMKYIQFTNGMKNKNESVDIIRLNHITFMKSFICTQ